MSDESRHCEERSDGAIQLSIRLASMDYFASLAKMVWTAPDGIIVPDW
jgi:hypothetical protein